jgi:hypothetical protein
MNTYTVHCKIKGDFIGLYPRIVFSNVGRLMSLFRDFVETWYKNFNSDKSVFDAVFLHLNFIFIHLSLISATLYEYLPSVRPA